jgi:triosephosphate isomerase
MKYVFGNWKMYLDNKQSLDLIDRIVVLDFDGTKVSSVVFPNQLSICRAVEKLKDTKVDVGAQNVNWVPAGAYTGATSAFIFAEVGCKYALVGHSERRHIFGETNEVVGKKMKACIESGLTPVLCIGETKEEKDAGKREEVLSEQLMYALKDLNKGNSNIIIAYEPVWAIGTGDACDPIEATKIHNWIKKQYTKYFESGGVIVLYGGSVDSENVLSYLQNDAISGVLVGGASTKIDSFSEIVKVAESL